MNIKGIGIDIVEIERVRKLIGSNPKFLKRVFTEGEIAYCRKKRKKWQHFAVRFAAKEAVWKALGKGGVALKNIEVRNKRNGSPEVKIKGKNLDNRYNVFISLTHSSNQAVACAIINGKG